MIATATEAAWIKKRNEMGKVGARTRNGITKCIFRVLKYN